MKEKTTVRPLLALLGLGLIAVLLSGCASLGLDKDAAKKKAKAAVESIDLSAATSAAVAASGGDYGKAFAELLNYAKRVKSAEAKAKVAGIDRASVAEAMKADGYQFTKTVFFDGVVVNDLKRISWKDEWVRTGTGSDASVEEVVAADGWDGSDLAASDEEGGVDWAAVIIGVAESNGIDVDK